MSPFAKTGYRQPLYDYAGSPQFQLERHIFPALGSVPLRGIDRAQLEICLSDMKRKGHATSTLRNVRATFSKVLQYAVERGFLEKNPAPGTRIREADTKKERRFYSSMEMRRLLAALSELCCCVVSVAVLTGMRIGEILALRWKRIDSLHGTMDVAETTRAENSSHRKLEAIVG
jgi:integrase